MVKQFKLFPALLAIAMATPVMAIAADKAAPAPQSANQSNGVLSGVVRDAEDVIIGASVMVKGTTKGASTDLDGAFTMAQWKFSGDKHKSLQVDTERTFHQRYPLVML